jgi:hypothetical protein
MRYYVDLDARETGDQVWAAVRPVSSITGGSQAESSVLCSADEKTAMEARKILA